MSEHEEFPTYIHLNEYSNAVSWADDPDSMAIDSTEYIRTDIVDKMLAEQREMCSKTCKTYINAAISTGELDNEIGQYVIDVVSDACLNAVEKSDDQQ